MITRMAVTAPVTLHAARRYSVLTVTFWGSLRERGTMTIKKIMFGLAMSVILIGAAAGSCTEAPEQESEGIEIEMERCEKDDKPTEWECVLENGKPTVRPKPTARPLVTQAPAPIQKPTTRRTRR
jgi:hypothetical protein